MKKVLYYINVDNNLIYKRNETKNKVAWSVSIIFNNNIQPFIMWMNKLQSPLETMNLREIPEEELALLL